MLMKKKYAGVLALGAATMLALSACSGGGSGDGGGDGGSEGGGSITVGYIEGWTDGQSIAYLLKDQFEKLGMTVELEVLNDNGPMYAALSQGDIDIHASGWPEVTHKSYMDEFGDDIESMGVWYDNGVLTIAVPSYSEIDSMADLKDNADLFGSEIVGIEPGAGLTEVTQTSMMPAYGLDDWTLSTSSTASMLTVLGDAIDNEEEVVVTLWRPFWAYAEYDVKDLEDPEGAMGEPEGLHMLGHKGTAEKFPEAAELMQGLNLDDQAYGELEMLITSEEYENDSEGAVDKWIEDNPEGFSTLITE
ncbi:glycine betaine ABC transporter substrate-binding protein [Leucobacter sp. GX24907]